MLLGVLSCSVLICILETRLCVALYSPFYSSHWETSFLTLSTLSRQDGSFLPEGTQNPGILLLSLEVTFTRDSWPMCSSELPASVIWGPQMHCCLAWETHVGQEKPYLAKDAESRNWVICQLLLLLPVGEWCSPVTALTHCASLAARHKWLSWKTKFTSWASDTMWIFIFFLMFN